MNQKEFRQALENGIRRATYEAKRTNPHYMFTISMGFLSVRFEECQSYFRTNLHKQEWKDGLNIRGDIASDMMLMGTLLNGPASEFFLKLMPDMDQDFIDFVRSDNVLASFMYNIYPE